jgi:autotransporter-associated beta strand protein
MGATIAQSSTLDFKAAGNVTLNSYGVSSSSAGGSMNFTNSSGSSKTVTFTNADNYITQASWGARGLNIKSADLTLDFVGNIQNSSTQTNTTTFDGAGNFIVRGSLLDSTNATGIRTIAKTGAGTLTLLGASNNYSGSTLVGGGTLEVGAAGALPVASSITVSNGATLRFNQASGGINVGSLTNAGTLEQNLITITSSGAVNLAGSTLKVNGTPSASSYTLVTGTSLTGTPTLSPAIPGYSLTNSNASLNLVGQPVQSGYATYLADNGLPADTAFNAKLDGVTAVGLKYAFASANGMPQNDGVTAVPVIAQLPNGIQQLTYTFDVKVDSALTVTYQTSTDLVEWAPTPAQAVSDGTGSSPTGFLKKQVQVTGSDRLFVRINVTR